MDKIKLKPCPFCGGKAQVIQSYRHYKEGKCAIRCVVCGNGTLLMTEEAATKAWNKRSTT